MKKKWTVGLVLCGASLLAASFAHAQEKQRLEYHSSPQTHPLMSALGSKSLELISEAPRGVELPAFKGERPLFAKWSSPMAPDGFLWIALDRTEKDATYDRLFIDANGDGRLADETATAAHLVLGSRTEFGPVGVIFKGKEGPVTYHLDFGLVTRGDRPRLSVFAGGWYEGPITVGREEKHCVLLDHSANGAFDDRSIDLEHCDLIQIGEEGDRDICLVGEFIEVDDTLYRLEVGREGDLVRLTEARDVKFGTVRVRDEMTELVAGGENGMLTLKPKKGVAKLPVGKYRVYQWVVEQEDETGGVWQSTARSLGNPDVFEIAEGNERRLVLGDPIISTLNVRRDDRTYTVSHAWQGQAGEQIQLTLNGSAPPPAAVHIQNADGSYDRSFTFEHG